MSQSQENRDELPNLTDTIHELDHRVSELEDEKIKLQSDIYNLKLKQSRMHRDMETIVSYLESQASKGG